MIAELVAELKKFSGSIEAAFKGELSKLETRIANLEGKAAPSLAPGAAPATVIPFQPQPPVATTVPPVTTPPVPPVVTPPTPTAVTCPVCNGGGTLTPTNSPASTVTCPVCNGTGTVLPSSPTAQAAQAATPTPAAS